MQWKYLHTGILPAHNQQTIRNVDFSSSFMFLVFRPVLPLARGADKYIKNLLWIYGRLYPKHHPG